MAYIIIGKNHRSFTLRGGFFDWNTTVVSINVYLAVITECIFDCFQKIVSQNTIYDVYFPRISLKKTPSLSSTTCVNYILKPLVTGMIMKIFGVPQL